MVGWARRYPCDNRKDRLSNGVFAFFWKKKQEPFPVSEKVRVAMVLEEDHDWFDGVSRLKKYCKERQEHHHALVHHHDLPSYTEDLVVGLVAAAFERFPPKTRTLNLISTQTLDPKLQSLNLDELYHPAATGSLPRRRAGIDPGRPAGTLAAKSGQRGDEDCSV